MIPSTAWRWHRLRYVAFAGGGSSPEPTSSAQYLPQRRIAYNWRRQVTESLATKQRQVGLLACPQHLARSAGGYFSIIELLAQAGLQNQQHFPVQFVINWVKRNMWDPMNRLLRDGTLWLGRAISRAIGVLAATLICRLP